MKTSAAIDQLSLFLEESQRHQALPVVVKTTFTAEPRESGGIIVADSLRMQVYDHPALGLEAGTGTSETECDWSAFLRQYGRAPSLRDKKKPWHYRGWLLYYRLLLESHPLISNRWDYWCRTMRHGRVLPEPIPQIHFEGIADPAIFKNIERWIRLVDAHASGWSAVDKLIDWLLWGVGFLPKPPELPEDLSEQLYRQVDIGPMLLKPHDYFGEWIALQKGNWNLRAFYPTPHSIVEMMVRMLMNPEEDLREKTVMDPCVGSGRMLLHASNFSLRLYGIDIDASLVKLTYLNGAFYVPWILRPFPIRFFRETKTQN
jgi:N-6 DNA Methylase